MILTLLLYFNQVSPRLRQPSYNLGHLAVTTLLNHLNDLPYEPNLQLNQLLVERESTTKLIEDSII